MALIGYGTIVEIADPATPTVFTAIANLSKIKPFGWKSDSIDTTTYQSPGKFREKISGLLDLGNVTLDMNFTSGDGTDVFLQGIIGLPKIVRVTFTNGVKWVASGFISDYSPDAPLDGKQSATVGFETSGQPTITAAAAPVNSVLPAISGLLANGNVLTVYEGVWSGAPTFTYVWKKGGVANGTTTKTYTTVVGDVAGIMTCTVTATNTTGSASATSSNLGAIT